MHRLQDQGLLEGSWRPAEAGPDRKYYRLTAKGRRALEAEKRQWLRVHEALSALWGPGLVAGPVAGPAAGLSLASLSPA